MSKIERSAICVYGHFSQPPRGHPLTGEIGIEPAAAPYDNWNERITDRCYRPNAETGNFQHISYSFSESLFSWLETNKPEIYKVIIESDMPETLENKVSVGNALATAYHHGILPLARRRDKRTQIMWGITAFEHRFGRKPLGFWLPEMAVDTGTLSLLAEAGIRYTVLAAQQIQAMPREGGSGPYKVELPHGRSIGVFVRNDPLSSELSFNIHNLGGAGHWAHNVLGPARKNSGSILLLATEGETFGHHYVGEDQFLHWLITREALGVGFGVTTLDRCFVDREPEQTVNIVEPSSWSDQHGLSNWATGGMSHGKDTTWKGALRRALDNAASELDRTYEDLTRSAKVDAWELRNHYAPVLLGEISEDDFLAELVPDIEPKASKQLKALLTAEELSQRMYTSYTFTNDELDSPQPRYAIACAAASLALAQRATGRDLAERLLPDLTVVESSNSTLTGADILRQVVEDYQLNLEIEA